MKPRHDENKRGINRQTHPPIRRIQVQQANHLSELLERLREGQRRQELGKSPRDNARRTDQITLAVEGVGTVATETLAKSWNRLLQQILARLQSLSASRKERLSCHLNSESEKRSVG